MLPKIQNTEKEKGKIGISFNWIKTQACQYLRRLTAIFNMMFRVLVLLEDILNKNLV